MLEIKTKVKHKYDSYEYIHKLKVQSVQKPLDVKYHHRRPSNPKMHRPHVTHGTLNTRYPSTLSSIGNCPVNVNYTPDKNGTCTLVA